MIAIAARLNHAPSLHIDIFLAIIAVIGDVGGGIGDQVVDINPNMVVTEILDGVKLHDKDVVGKVVNVAGVEAKVLVGAELLEAPWGGDNEGNDMATKRGVLGDDSKGKGGGGKVGTVNGVLELKSIGVGVANELACLVQ